MCRMAGPEIFAIGEIHPDQLVVAGGADDAVGPDDQDRTNPYQGVVDDPELSIPALEVVVFSLPCRQVLEDVFYDTIGQKQLWLEVLLDDCRLNCEQIPFLGIDAPMLPHQRNGDESTQGHQSQAIDRPLDEELPVCRAVWRRHDPGPGIRAATYSLTTCNPVKVENPFSGRRRVRARDTTLRTQTGR
jgi:hypothetical protein